MSEAGTKMKLHIGCGGKNIPGFWNLDKMPYPHVNTVFDLELTAEGVKLPWDDNTFDRLLMVHTFEHLVNVLPIMQELWRIAKPDASMIVVTPYGSSDNADEDPTHVRRVFKETFIYFSQAVYGVNDYGYRGDWDVRHRRFLLDATFFAPGTTEEQLGMAIANMRNIVVEFQVELVAIKPARDRGCSLKPPRDSFSLVDPQ